MFKKIIIIVSFLLIYINNSFAAQEINRKKDKFFKLFHTSNIDTKIISLKYINKNFELIKDDSIKNLLLTEYNQIENKEYMKKKYNKEIDEKKKWYFKRDLRNTIINNYFKELSDTEQADLIVFTDNWDYYIINKIKKNLKKFIPFLVIRLKKEMKNMLIKEKIIEFINDHLKKNSYNHKIINDIENIYLSILSENNSIFIKSKIIEGLGDIGKEKYLSIIDKYSDYEIDKSKYPADTPETAFLELKKIFFKSINSAKEHIKKLRDGSNR